jgi:hypothetical protein
MNSGVKLPGIRTREQSLIVTISFKVRNKVRIGPHFPVEKKGSTLFLQTDNGVLTSVGVVRRGVDVKHAPKFTHPSSTNGGVHPTLSVESRFFLVLAERELREWQAVLASYVIVDIDFDDVSSTFTPENESERAAIHVSSLNRAVDKQDRNPIEFEHIARAFLMKEEASARLEDVAHFRDASIAQSAGRNVDAYNGYFLFLETRYCDGKTKKNEQVKRLLDDLVFVNKLKSAVKSFKTEFAGMSSRLSVAGCDESDVSKLVEEIILLRGELRHHSLNSPRRWDPNNVKRYEPEARFLGAVCGYILLDELFLRTYEPEVMQAFLAQANKNNFRLALLIHRLPYDGHSIEPIRVTFPVCEPDIRTAVTAFSNVLDATRSAHGLMGLRSLICQSEDRKIEVFTAALGRPFDDPGERILVGTCIRTSIEYIRDGMVMPGAFRLNIAGPALDRAQAWDLGAQCTDHFFQSTPDHELLSLKVFAEKPLMEIFSYRVGPGVGR